MFTVAKTFFLFKYLPNWAYVDDSFWVMTEVYSPYDSFPYTTLQQNKQKKKKLYFQISYEAFLQTFHRNVKKKLEENITTIQLYQRGLPWPLVCNQAVVTIKALNISLIVWIDPTGTWKKKWTKMNVRTSEAKSSGHCVYKRCWFHATFCRAKAMFSFN